MMKDSSGLHFCPLYLLRHPGKHNKRSSLQSSKKNEDYNIIKTLIFYCQMGILNKLKRVIEMTDFFHSTQMLRYENQNQYRTFTGGILSTGIIITIIIGFANMILDTLNRTSIISTQNVITRPDPTSTIITASPDENFMFGIEIWQQNLSSPVRYFDVAFNVYIQSAGTLSQEIRFQLEPCTRQHWSSIAEVDNNFDKLGINGWLCPQIGTQFQLVGKYTSDYFTEHIITVAPCKNQTDPTRPCAPQQEIDQLFYDNGDWFYFGFYYINTILNPNQPTYKTIYLQDTAYVTFGRQLGIQASLYFSDYTISSDYSIWPFQSIEEDTGFMTTAQPRGNAYSIDPKSASNNTAYVTYTIVKSFQSFYYGRQVQKISNVFSFMGGLVGALMAGMFIINSYTDFAYEITIAMEIFKKKKENNQQSSENKDFFFKVSFVNFFQFVQYYWHALLKYFKKTHSNDNLEHLYECRKEILRQLDVKSLIKRIIFLEYSMTYIFSEDQLESLQTYKPTQPQDVRKVRKRFQNINSQNQFQSNSTSSNNEQISDMIEPPSAFNLNVILSSSKVANIHSQLAKSKTKMIIAQNKNGNENLDIESVSSESNQKADKSPNLQNKRDKATRIKMLVESAQEGNQISKRILRSIRQIQQSNSVST